MITSAPDANMKVPPNLSKEINEIQESIKGTFHIHEHYVIVVYERTRVTAKRERER